MEPIPVREELLGPSSTQTSLASHTFDYPSLPRLLLSALGLDYESKRGYIGLDYYGRTVTVKDPSLWR
ncbi:hypothetical protein HPP92_016562 [Vanilla planifolia]|uniref:Uncharacterized protein n=1 Tax=Vanilla planifolia TaxID=51239 RepID=A0A835UUB4_VANPL|nr:hypothetical protein HPP92_017145 [Vanilla planifolia]KAG0472016.1 hypothetical protein HPP92_016562 [Vanilla planifolia]